MKRIGKRFAWSEYDIGFLRLNYGDLTLEDIGRVLGCSFTTVRMKAIEIGLVHRQACRAAVWTDSQIACLKENYPTTTLADLAQLIGYSGVTIQKKAKELGLRRADGYRVQNFNRRYVRDYVRRNK